MQSFRRTSSEQGSTVITHDTAMEKLKSVAYKSIITSENLTFEITTYLLGFGSYKGFEIMGRYRLEDKNEKDDVNYQTKHKDCIL